MKVDIRNGNLLIEFDGIPKMLYANKKGFGCGEVFIDGEQRKGIIDVKIKAHTADADSNPPLEYIVKYWEDMELKTTGNLKPLCVLSVSVSLKDTDIFESLVGILKSLASDEEIPGIKRMEITNKIQEILTKH